MRGKTIFSLSMAVVLVSIMFTGIARAPTTPKIRVDPVDVLKNPGDVFALNIWVDDVVDLYAFGFELKYKPFAALLIVQTIKEGPFLKSDGEETDFSGRNDPMPGVLVAGNTRIGEVGGVSGSGIIAVITFKVKTGGICDLRLASTDLIDYYGTHIVHDVISGKFMTPYAAVQSAGMTGLHDNSGVAVIGSTLTLSSTVKNTIGTLPLTVKVKYVLTRTDGKKIILWSPQPSTTELNVNGYTDFGGSNWVTVGTAPYLDAVGDGNYIEADELYDLIWYFDLSDMTLGAADKITGISLEAYSMADAAGTTAEVYINTIAGMTAVGVIEPGTTGDWYFDEYPGALAAALYDEATINSAQLAIMHTGGSKITIDAIRLFITVEQEIVVLPKQTVTMPPVYYTTTMADKGKYPSVKAYCYYSYLGGPFFQETAGKNIAVTGSGPNPKIRYVLIINPPKPGQGNV